MTKEIKIPTSDQLSKVFKQIAINEGLVSRMHFVDALNICLLIFDRLRENDCVTIPTKEEMGEDSWKEDEMDMANRGHRL